MLTQSLSEDQVGGQTQSDADQAGARRAAVRSRVTQVTLIVMVIVLGCANNISKQIATKPLNRYTFFLSLSTSITYVPIYGIGLCLWLWLGYTSRRQLDFVWKTRSSPGFPIIAFLVIAALGDTIGDTIGMVCTPYVAGPIHSLLTNFTPMFTCPLSMILLGKTYSFFQCIALLAVLLAVVIGVVPAFESTNQPTKIFFAVTLAGSCIFNALSFVVKEMVFERFNSWRVGQTLRGRGESLNVFVVNYHVALFQLPLTIMTIPLCEALKQFKGDTIDQFIDGSFDCVFKSKCGPESTGAQWALLCTVVYVTFNILWNISVLMSVKHNGALATFVAMKAMFPVSTVFFALDWPLLGKTPLTWQIALSVLILLPSIAVYKVASGLQEERARTRPSDATCCFPLCTK